MKYCIRCGRPLDDQQACERCSRTYHQDGKEWRDTKKCKKCHKAIPVSANFCPFCDYDQAKIVWEEHPRTEAKPEKEEPFSESEGMDFARQIFKEIFDDQDQTNNSQSTSQASRLHSQATSSYHGDDETNRLAQMVQQQMQQPERPQEIKQLNETERPGLFVSTRLALRDAFKYNKRMGRADYWYAQLGIVLLVMVASMLAGVVLSALQGVLSNAVLIQVTFGVATIIGVSYFVICFTATVRRMHDIGMPGALALLLLFTTLGTLIVWVIASLPHNPQATKYDFGKKNSASNPAGVSTHATAAGQAPVTSAETSQSHNTSTTPHSATTSETATSELQTVTFYPKSQQLASSEHTPDAPVNSTSESNQ